jgi:hypothetical protein
VTLYTIDLKTANKPMPIEADKFYCEEDGYTVFYQRPSKDEPAEEAARIKTSNIKRIKED